MLLSMWRWAARTVGRADSGTLHLLLEMVYYFASGAGNSSRLKRTETTEF